MLRPRSGPVAAVAVGWALLATVTGCSEDDVAVEQSPRPTVTPSRLEVADIIDQTGPQRVSVTVIGREVTGDTGTVEVRKNSPVQLTVLADSVDQAVVEGYGDVRTEDGRPVIFEFLADEPGTFEVRLRGSGLLLTTLVVA